MEGFRRTVAFFQKRLQGANARWAPPGAFSIAVPAGEEAQRPAALKSET